MNNENALILSLLIVNKKMLIDKNIGEVSSRDIFEQNSTTFHTNGLYSERIFGVSGSSERLDSYGFIDLGHQILHPLIYRTVISLSTLYKGLIDGNKYAVFDDKIKDFIESTEEDGDTGYKFFLKHFKDMDFKTKDIVISRKFKIDFLDMFSLKDMIIDSFIVIAAGLRDYVVAESGKVMDNEINGLYRKLIGISNSIKIFKDDTSNNLLINKVMIKLQKSVNEIYEYLENMLEGKGGYLQNKLTKRQIVYGTRNVITSSPVEISNFKDKFNPGALTSTVGIFQSVKGLFPQALFLLRSKYLHDVFDPESTLARLIDIKTLKRDLYKISEKGRSKWVSDDGIEKMFNKLKQDANKQKPIVIDGYYLFMIYEDGDNITLFTNIDDLQDGYDKNKIRPITYGELIFLVMYELVPKYLGIIVRYPITGSGSLVPTDIQVKSTVTNRRVNFKLGVNSEPMIINYYPVDNDKYYNSLSIGAVTLDGLGADKTI